MIYEPEGLRATTVNMVDRRDVFAGNGRHTICKRRNRPVRAEVDEARVNALARGLALLAEVDSRSALSQDATAFAQDNHLQTLQRVVWAEVSDNRIFSRRYEVGVMYLTSYWRPATLTSHLMMHRKQS